MKKQQNVMGRMDYFSSIDRLANDFAPKQKTPLSVGNYDYIGAFSPPTQKRYDPYKQQSTFSNPKKRFDPYENTWGRQVQQTLHVGPAQSKELNKKQMVELIHELKEKKIRDRKAVEDAKEIKSISRKFMNSPWNAVPEKYRKKYERMDFDGDGVINKFDCYPFDYDRQANIFSAITSFFSPPKPAPAPAPAPKPAPAPAPKPAPAPAPKTATAPAPAPKPVTNIFNVTPTPFYTPKPVQSIAPTPTKTSGGSSSGTTPQPKMYYINADGSRGAEVPADKPGTMVKTQSTIGGETKVSQVQPDGSLKVISTTSGQLPSPGYYFGPSNSGGGSGGGGGGGSAPAQLTITTIPELTPLEKTLMDFVYKYDTGYKGTMIDENRKQQLYLDILEGRITDPAFKAALEAVMGPAMTDYLNQKFNMDKDYQKQQRMLSSVVERKIKDIALVGGQNVANKYSVVRAQQILQARSDAMAAGKQARDIAAAKAYEEKKSGIALSEVEKRPSEYTTTYDTTRSNTMSIAKGTPIAELSPDMQSQYIKSLTPTQQAQYNALHK